MDCCNPTAGTQFWQDRLNSTIARITALEEAVLLISSGAVLSYTLDTGQTRTTVTKESMSVLMNMLDGLYNQVATLQARLGCGGTTYVSPIF